MEMGHTKPTGEIIIRAATLADIDWVATELKEFDRHFGAKLPLFGEHSKKLLEAFIQGHVMLLADVDGIGPIGLIGGWGYLHPFNNAIRMLTLGFWWVSEKYRGGRAASLLLDSFTEIGKMSYDWVSFAVSVDLGLSDAAMARRGYTLKEKSYLLEV